MVHDLPVVCSVCLLLLSYQVSFIVCTWQDVQGVHSDHLAISSQTAERSDVCSCVINLALHLACLEMPVTSVKCLSRVLCYHQELSLGLAVL